MADYRQLRNQQLLILVPQPMKGTRTGKGILNNTINGLPFEMHWPTYSYLGPGTKLEARLKRGDKPKNKLDELALQHDLAYSKSNNLPDRHNADYALQEGAWNRVLAKDAGFGEKAAAWVTTNAMKVKRKLGAGLLTKYPVNLSTEQQTKISEAVQKGKSVTVTVEAHRTKDSIMSDTYLPLTNSQIKNLKQGKRQIKLSVKQLKKIKTGGFLPALLAAAPVVASVVASLANAYSNKKTNDRLVEERVRHNKELEKYSSRSGHGVYINKKPAAGKGVYINKKPATGKGVRVKTSRATGNGLLTQLLKKKKTLR